MCGIVGYAGAGGQSAEDVLLAGLVGLDRSGTPGRDGGEGEGVAAGVVVSADGGLGAVWWGAGLSEASGASHERGGPAVLDGLRGELGRRPLPAGMCGIGRLGGVPGLDGAGRVAVVLAGAVRAGASGTGRLPGAEVDAEVVARLVAEAFSSCGELVEAVRQARGLLAGAYAVLAVHADEPDTVVGAAAGLSLVVAAGDGEVRVASDVAAWGDGVARSAVLEGDQVVLVRRELDEVRWEITDARGAVVAP